MKSETTKLRRHRDGLKGEGQDGTQIELLSRSQYLSMIFALVLSFDSLWNTPEHTVDEGGIYIISFTIALTCVAMPMIFLEIFLARYSLRGPVYVWKLAVPIASGLGFCMTLITSSFSVMGGVEMAISMHYFYKSLQGQFPWMHCDPSWADDNCIDNSSQMLTYCKYADDADPICTNKSLLVSEAEYYLNNMVGYKETVPETKHELAFCLIAYWVVIFFLATTTLRRWNPLLTSTMATPVVFFSLMLMYMLSTEVDPTVFVEILTAGIDKLGTSTLWVKAVGQVVSTVPIGTGAFFVCASQSRPKIMADKDAVIIYCVCLCTHILYILITLVTFAKMAQELDVPVEQLKLPGKGNLYVVFAYVFSRWKTSTILCSVYFFCLASFTFNNKMVFTECIVENIMEITQKRAEFHTFFTGFVCCISGVLGGLAILWPHGQVLLEYTDYNLRLHGMLFMLLLEALVAFKLYGIKRLNDDISFMYRRKIAPIWVGMWRMLNVGSMVFFAATISDSTITQERDMLIEYYFSEEGFGYTVWKLAFIIVFLPLFIMPIYDICTTPGSYNIFELLNPRFMWGPPNKKLRIERKMYDSEKCISG